MLDLDVGVFVFCIALHVCVHSIIKGIIRHQNSTHFWICVRTQRKAETQKLHKTFPHYIKLRPLLSQWYCKMLNLQMLLQNELIVLITLSLNKFYSWERDLGKVTIKSSLQEDKYTKEPIHTVTYAYKNIIQYI